jgi:hypothetical protein
MDQIAWAGQTGSGVNGVIGYRRGCEVSGEATEPWRRGGRGETEESVPAFGSSAAPIFDPLAFRAEKKARAKIARAIRFCDVDQRIKRS